MGIRSCISSSVNPVVPAASKAPYTASRNRLASGRIERAAAFDVSLWA
jgi:hypothetical protein